MLSLLQTNLEKCTEKGYSFIIEASQYIPSSHNNDRLLQIVLDSFIMCIKEQPSDLSTNGLVKMFLSAHETSRFIQNESLEACLKLISTELSLRISKKDALLISLLPQIFEVYYESPQYLTNKFITNLKDIQTQDFQSSILTLEFLNYHKIDVSSIISNHT